MKWMQEAFKNARGQLHKQMGVPQGMKIPMARLEKAAGASGKLGMRARAALNARRANA